MVWYGMVWYGMVWYIWYGMLWYGMAWYIVVWHGTARYGMGSYRVSYSSKIVVNEGEGDGALHRRARARSAERVHER